MNLCTDNGDVDQESVRSDRALVERSVPTFGDGRGWAASTRQRSTRNEPPWVGRCSTSNARRPCLVAEAIDRHRENMENCCMIDRVELVSIDQSLKVGSSSIITRSEPEDAPSAVKSLRSGPAQHVPMMRSASHPSEVKNVRELQAEPSDGSISSVRQPQRRFGSTQVTGTAKRQKCWSR